MAHNDVTDTNFDPTDVQLTVGGLIIREFTGLERWRTYHEVTLNRGPGGRAYGFNRQQGNNGCTFQIKVKRTSPDLIYLQELVQTQLTVAIAAEVVENLALYTSDQEIKLGCEKGVLQGGERGLGNENEAGEVVFEVMGIGPLSGKKSELAQD